MPDYTVPTESRIRDTKPADVAAGTAGPIKRVPTARKAPESDRSTDRVREIAGASGAGRSVSILGTRGIPAAHGGFETFAERLADYLVAHGWKVTVYCQAHGRGKPVVDSLNGVERITIPVTNAGVLSSVIYDFKCILHVMRRKTLCLTLGYNTAAFCALLRLAGQRNVINMDGIEWKRAKWGRIAKLWFRLNERAGFVIGDHLIADHPRIATHLQDRGAKENKITMIPYGAAPVGLCADDVLGQYGLTRDRYFIVIARPEPENSILEIVRAFSGAKTDFKLMVLGKFHPETSDYHRQVMAAAGDQVVFPGAIYEPAVVGALRYHSRAYLHGHQVGGTNPSLLEAMAAGNYIIAHDNEFNRWVAGPGAAYFSSVEQLRQQIEVASGPSQSLAAARKQIAERFATTFTWDHVLPAYESLLATQWQLSRHAVRQ